MYGKGLQEGKIQNRKWKLNHLATNFLDTKNNKLPKCALLKHAQARYLRNILKRQSLKRGWSSPSWSLKCFHPWKPWSVFFVGGETWVLSRSCAFHPGCHPFSFTSNPLNQATWTRQCPQLFWGEVPFLLTRELMLLYVVVYFLGFVPWVIFFRWLNGCVASQSHGFFSEVSKHGQDLGPWAYRLLGT